MKAETLSRTIWRGLGFIALTYMLKNPVALVVLVQALLASSGVLIALVMGGTAFSAWRHLVRKL